MEIYIKRLFSLVCNYFIKGFSLFVFCILHQGVNICAVRTSPTTLKGSLSLLLNLSKSVPITCAWSDQERDSCGGEHLEIIPGRS